MKKLIIMCLMLALVSSASADYIPFGPYVFQEDMDTSYDPISGSPNWNSAVPAGGHAWIDSALATGSPLDPTGKIQIKAGATYTKAEIRQAVAGADPLVGLTSMSASAKLDGNWAQALYVNFTTGGHELSNAGTAAGIMLYYYHLDGVIKAYANDNDAETPVTSLGEWAVTDGGLFWMHQQNFRIEIDGPTVNIFARQNANMNPWDLGASDLKLSVAHGIALADFGELRTGFTSVNNTSGAGYWDIWDVGIRQVPEPATMCLLSLGALGLIRRKR